MESTREEPWFYFPHVLIGFNCWPIGFQVQTRVGRTKTSVNLRPWERLAGLLVPNRVDFMQLHRSAGCEDLRENSLDDQGAF